MQLPPFGLGSVLAVAVLVIVIVLVVIGHLNPLLALLFGLLAAARLT